MKEQAAAERLAALSPGVLVTGANGHLGRRLLRRLGSCPRSAMLCRALVRSEAAARTLERYTGIDAVVGSYTDCRVLQRVLAGCDTVIHLVGIIKESTASTFQAAHVETTRALADAAAAAGVRRIVYLSIVGAAPEHSNPCLRSKGEAERLLAVCPVPSTVFRVPMVLGEGDYASAALHRRASAGQTVAFRAESLEQPIYAGDVIEGVLRAALDRTAADHHFDLPGPETLTRAALIRRAAAMLGQPVRVWSLPVGLGMAAAWLLERLSVNPPMTRAMLGVLDHDDDSTNGEALAALELELTDLDETLRRCLELAA